MNQDFVAWVGKGTQADRTKENLGRSDRGVAMVRKRFLDDLKRIENGEDPNNKSFNGSSALMRATEREHFEILKFLSVSSSINFRSVISSFML